MNAELLVLRFIHVVGGVFWVGAALFNAFFLLPVMKESGPAAAPVMIGLQKRKMMVVLPVTGLIVILAGIRLMMIASNGFARSYFATGSGKGFALGGIFATVALLIGLIVVRPAMSRVAGLQQSAASDEISRDKIKAEIATLQRRMAMSSTSATLLLLAAAIMMSISRYL